MENELISNISTIDFADSEILSYTVKREYLMLFIELWNAEILEIKFLGHAASLDMGCFRIAEVEEVFESTLLERLLGEYYEIKQKEQPFRVFKFNSDDSTVLEIVCKNISVRRIRK